MQETETRGGWLSREELRDARERLPILYVNLVPVRVDERSQVTQIGLLLRASDDGQIQRELVSGRVLYHERLRDAVLRHIERDLGPMALPRCRSPPSRSRSPNTSPRQESRPFTTRASMRSPWDTWWCSWATANRRATRSIWPG